MLLLTAYFTLWFLVLAASALLFWVRRRPAPAPLPQPWPRVSILIAARNEEAAIGRCLQAIRQLSYPAELVEVLLGDDASTDQTRAVAQAAMQGYAGQFRCLTITEPLGLARGKANVLAHLARAATTEYFCITDADIAVPTGWIQGLLPFAQPGVGTVTGLTVVEGPRLFDQLQGLDWLQSLGLVQVVSDFGRPVTAMGNNMLVTRAAYEATGGYEQLPFSVTEDYALFEAVLRRGFTFRNVFRPEVLAVSLPISTPARLLHQRRRWLRGVEALPWWLQGGLLFYAGFYPLLLVLAWVASPLAALSVLVGKMLLQGLLAAACYHRAGRRLSWHLLPAFELYTIALTVGLSVFRLLPLSFDWKGRAYK
ncbi:glycosyltransferase [Hymenobacter chitinivorans]|uniref:Cellulose synthase/poly-beta-1,6-N-acetylglucosamine synthase-like glycosyltransferase n=1 Tax=Hymenobacter chitinivorans DSM 11115 TaxID=1121954 RepID=A0A2M9BNQ7_9BACT|nr:glycosyltransferase [Hymenobacter chitinivorans]PJJ59587.1 cellulose synthase/poly-beta-1,6-N-acetylglucosamine synthase-like glycosyltransferase [Hymenobacter chitinivorans DSM 11115]